MVLDKELPLPNYNYFSSGGKQQNTQWCFLIQPLDHEGRYNKSCWEKYIWVFKSLWSNKIKPRTLQYFQISEYMLNIFCQINSEKKLPTKNNLSLVILKSPLYLHQVAHIDCSTPGGKKHETLTGDNYPHTTPFGGSANLSRPADAYRKTFNPSRTKFQNLNDSRLILRLSPPNTLKPGVKSRMKM